jgi:hypothetical protein
MLAVAESGRPLYIMYGALSRAALLNIIPGATNFPKIGIASFGYYRAIPLSLYNGWGSMRIWVAMSWKRV